ncbi:MAG: SDR family oxidoreductase [Hyphomicrobiales bacterium]|nr:SDR family oxidoreductase [Hyphomicrobiales bacterium]MDE2017129.1 SDR family oxidoreductase [Hyphomicrobiales bacterium]
MNESGNTILVTGGTSGIGRALAHEFHALDNRVIVTGRRKALLDEVTAAHPGMVGYVLDVDDPTAIRDFATMATSKHPDLNVLLNNAGIMPIEDLTADVVDVSAAEAVIATNLLAPIRLTAALLPHLRRRARSAVINVSSGLAFVPLAITPTYNATKAAIHSYTMSLRRQLRETSVEVIEIVPPGVQTDLMPGMADNPNMMPLHEFIAETMAVFRQKPTPSEIKVKTVGFLRDAEAEGRFERTFETLNGSH